MNLILKAYTLSECMEIMASYAAAYEKQGLKNLIFCEDRLTLVAERALLKTTGGTFQSSVSTFARYLSADVNTITKQGSVMAVGSVMTKLQRENKLQCFTSLTGVGNNAKCIYETLAQLSASEVTPEILKESMELLPEDMLKRKVSDLATIYEEYLSFLSENGYVDESKYLSLLPDCIKNSREIKESNVFFLCFNSFTAQAMRTVRASIENAKNVIGIFCAGNEELYANRGLISFEKACKDYKNTKTNELGTPLEGEAEILRKGLFNPERVKKTPTERVRIFEAEDRAAEADYVAVQIKRQVVEKGCRFRDFALLVPNLSAYALPLKKSFAEYGIPYFLDEKKSLKAHPLSRFLLDCFKTVRERFSPASVQSLAQNPFFGESDEYRNYLLKFSNYRGGAKREIKKSEAVQRLFPDFGKLEGGRERVLLATKGIKSKSTGRGYCLAILEILNCFHVKERLEELEEEIEDLAHKGYLAQIYNALEKLLKEAELLTSGEEMTVAQFEAVLKDGLEATEISLIPLKSDAVFIGDIAESRIEKVDFLFAMGMTEDVPARGTDTAIVSDKEIARLAEVKTLLEPTVAEVNLRTRESVCLNLCTFTHTLHLSYPLPADGDEPSVSEIFRYINEVFCGLDGGKLQREKKAKESDFPYQCSAITPAIRQLLTKKNEYELCKEDTRREYSSLYSALDKLSVTEKDDFLMERGGQVCVEHGVELFFSGGKISPTGLETYFSCPFKNFVERGLKVKDREETTVLAVDTGSFIHELLDKTMQKSSHIQSEEEMKTYALEVGKELLQKSVYAMQQDTASGVFFSEKLLNEGAEVVLSAFRQVKNSDFTVEETEVGVETPILRGKIDRVDGTDKYIRIIDYKTGSIDDSASSYYTGRKIQLQLYMSNVKGERIPAGVFYFPASVDYSASAEGKYRMQGFLNGDEDALKCGDKNIDEKIKSEYFPASLKNNAKSQRVMDEQTFRDFLDYSVFVARKGCEELKEGYVAPSPYKGTCQYCKYGGMCGFSKELIGEREEKDVSPKTIAKIAEIARDGVDGKEG